MQIEFYKDGKNLMVKVPGESKPVTPFEVLMAFGMLSKEKLIEKLGETRPEIVVNENVDDGEALRFVSELEKYLNKIYG